VKTAQELTMDHPQIALRKDFLKVRFFPPFFLVYMQPSVPPVCPLSRFKEYKFLSINWTREAVFSHLEIRNLISRIWTTEKVISWIQSRRCLVQDRRIRLAYYEISRMVPVKDNNVDSPYLTYTFTQT
jgi:hypothetical protein